MNRPLVEEFDPARYEPRSKVVSLSEAVRTLVSPRMSLHFAYSHGRAIASQLEVIRQFAGRSPRFTVITPSVANLQTALLTTNIADRLIINFAGELYPSAKANPLIGRIFDAGEIEVEHWSLWTFVARLAAGALGVPIFPVRSLSGSGIAAEHLGTRYFELPDPASPSQSMGVVTPLQPDLTFVHGVAADPSGNVVMTGPYGETYWGALAAKQGVIATVERIVPTEQLREHSALVKIPGHVVRAVCKVPFGTHPFGFNSTRFPGVDSYAEDDAFIESVAGACSDPERFDAWVTEWVLGTEDHAAYLEKLGRDRTRALVHKAQPERWREDAATVEARVVTSPEATASEVMVAAGSRWIERRARCGGHETILAGVGLANLASWLAARALREQGLDVELMTEIGMYGYEPLPGEPFVFASRNIATAKALTDVTAILGTFVSGSSNRCLGAIGGTFVDDRANVGTTFDQAGRFIIGSGGANDIASSASEVVLVTKQSAARFVSGDLRYITSPGHRVRTIVTQFGVFERYRDQQFELSAIHETAASSLEEGVERVRSSLGWADLAVRDDLMWEAAPTKSELRLMRLYDPNRVLLGRHPVSGEAPVPPLDSRTG